MSLFRSFLARVTGLLSGPATADATQRLRVTNRTRGEALLADSVELADTASRRSKGLLGRKGMAAGEALWIVPCESVHTFWMQFSLDLVYLDRRHRVVKVRTQVPPWRISLCLRAHSVIELPAGAVLPGMLARGDQLSFSAPAGDEAKPSTASLEKRTSQE